MGGVIGALRHRATEEYTALDKAHQATMKRVMLRMVAVEGGELARRRVYDTELDYPDEAENSRVVRVVRRLEQARLLVSDTTEENIPYVEPAHDALVRAWDKLLVWTREAEEYLPLQRRLNQAVADWEQGADAQTKRDLLWHDDPRLPQIKSLLVGETPVESNWLQHQGRKFKDVWVTQPLKVIADHWLNRAELTFVQASLQQRRKEARRLTGTITAVFLVLTALTIFALNQVRLTGEANTNLQTEVVTRTAAEADAVSAAATAVAERNVAVSRDLVLQSQQNLDGPLDLALLLAIEATKTNSTTIEAKSSLLRALLHNPYNATFLHGHTNPVNSVAISPDGQFIASAGCNKIVNNACEMGEIRFWDATSKQMIGTPLVGHEGSITSIAFSPDGRVLASAGEDNLIVLWDVQQRQPIESPLTYHEEAVTHVTFHPTDNTQLASSSKDGNVILWDTVTLQAMHIMDVPRAEDAFNSESDYNPVVAITFNPTGTLLAVADREKISLWDISNDKPSFLYKSPSYSFGSYYNVVFAPDGQTLASVRCEDLFDGDKCMRGTIQLWDSMLQEITNVADDSWTIKNIAFSPDGKLFAAGGCAEREFQTSGNCSKGEIFIWTTNSSGGLYSDLDNSLIAHTGTVSTLAFTPDSQNLIVGAKDGLLSSWSLDTFALQTSLPGLSLSSLPNAAGLPPTTLVFNPNGDILVASDYLDPVRLWDINNQTELYTLTASSDIAFSPDGQTLATVNKWAEGKVILWDIKSGQRLKTLSNETVEPVTSIAFSPNGRTLAMGGCIRADNSSCETGVVYLLDIGAGQLGSTPLIHPTPSLEDPIHTIAFHADGQTLISANYFDVILWDLDTGKPTSLPLGESQWVSAIALNSQDTLLAVATGSVITLWDPSTGKQVGQPFQGHTKTIKSVDFGLDGAILASTAFDEVNAGGETFLWQVSSRKRIGNSLNARNGTAIAFHPDGHLIAGVFEYDGLVLWDMRLDSWQEQACVLANRNLTQDEWEQFMGSGIEYRPSCPVKLPHRVFKF